MTDSKLKADYRNLMVIARSKHKPKLMDIGSRRVSKLNVNSKGLVHVTFLDGTERSYTKEAATRMMVKVYDRTEAAAYAHRSLVDSDPVGEGIDMPNVLVVDL